MNKTITLLMIVLVCVVIFSQAQSGRKIKSSPAPAPTPESQNSEEYSESSSSNPSVLSPRLNKDKNKKSETTSSTTQADSQNNETTTNSEDVVKVETNLVTIPVSVYERSGIYVSDLRQSDFKIFEDGIEQKIAYFGTTDQPFTVILLIDISPSTSYKIEEIQNAAIAFVGQLKAEDRVMVIEFDSSVHVLTDFTNDREKIYKAIRRTSFGNGTSLYEVVKESLRKKLGKVAGRKAIVLFTDGVDTTSRGASFSSTLEDAEEGDSVIFPIYYNTFFDNTGIGKGGPMSTPPILGLPKGSSGAPTSADYTRGRAYLEALAAATGGRMFRAESTPGGLISAFEGIAKELRSQYSIGYYPQVIGVTGQRKQIKVRVYRANVAVRARDSYVVGATTTSPPSTKK